MGTSTFKRAVSAFRVPALGSALDQFAASWFGAAARAGALHATHAEAPSAGGAVAWSNQWMRDDETGAQSCASVEDLERGAARGRGVEGIDACEPRCGSTRASDPCADNPSAGEHSAGENGADEPNAAGRRIDEQGAGGCSADGPGVAEFGANDFADVGNETDEFALHGLGQASGWGPIVESVSDPDLLEMIASISALRRRVDSALAVVSAELAARTARVGASEGVPRRLGFKSPEELVATELGVPITEARRFQQVGAAVTERRSFLGDVLPAEAGHVADAVDAGVIGLTAADEIIQFRKRLAARVDHDTLAEGEAMLVRSAPELTLRQLRQAIGQLEARLDQDGIEPRLDRQVMRRSLRFRTDADGLVHMTGCLDPITAAPIRTAIDHLITQHLRGTDDARADRAAGNDADAGSSSRDSRRPVFRPVIPEPARPNSTGSEHRDSTLAHDRSEPVDEFTGPITERERTMDQLAADALAMLCGHALGCRSDELPQASGTVLMRMSLADLGVLPQRRSIAAEKSAGDEGAGDESAGDESTGGESTGGEVDQEPSGDRLRGDGDAPLVVNEIEGFGAIDVARARRLAAAADIIPVVLGTEGEVLDLGRRARHFSRAQRLALVERDGGCAFCGLPASMTEAHHIRWWKRHDGATDLDNGVLLCRLCHHRIHEGWDVEVARAPGGGTVWFRPPYSISLDRTPRLGGRKRFDPAFRDAYPPGPPPHASWSAHTSSAAVGRDVPARLRRPRVGGPNANDGSDQATSGLREGSDRATSGRSECAATRDDVTPTGSPAVGAADMSVWTARRGR